MVSKADERNSDTFSLPTMVTSPSDISRLARELETLENSLQQLKVRGGDGHISLPATTKSMEKLAELNKVNLLHAGDRHALNAFLVHVQKQSLVMHMSFSSEPAPRFLEKILVWIRREIDPLVLVTVGLQPAIGAGCIIRTTNKYFDLSLRQTFIDKRELLLEQIIPPASAEQPTQVFAEVPTS